MRNFEIILCCSILKDDLAIYFHCVERRCAEEATSKKSLILKCKLDDLVVGHDVTFTITKGLKCLCREKFALKAIRDPSILAAYSSVQSSISSVFSEIQSQRQERRLFVTENKERFAELINMKARSALEELERSGNVLK